MKQVSTLLRWIGALAMLTLMSSAQAGWISYVEGTQFGTAAFGGGDATGIAELVPNFGDPGDFTTFTAGHIALIDRGGGIEFSTKVLNAQNAGAIGVVILDHPPIGSLGMGGGLDSPQVTIPSVRLEELLGVDLKAELLADPTLLITLHISLNPNIFERFVDAAAVPEPGSLSLCVLGFACIFLMGLRARRSGPGNA